MIGVGLPQVDAVVRLVPFVRAGEMTAEPPGSLPHQGTIAVRRRALPPGA